MESRMRLRQQEAGNNIMGYASPNIAKQIRGNSQMQSYQKDRFTTMNMVHFSQDR